MCLACCLCLFDTLSIPSSCKREGRVNMGVWEKVGAAGMSLLCRVLITNSSMRNPGYDVRLEYVIWYTHTQQCVCVCVCVCVCIVIILLSLFVVTDQMEDLAASMRISKQQQ